MTVIIEKLPVKSYRFVAKNICKDELTILTVDKTIYTAIFPSFHLIFLCFGLLPHTFKAISEPVILNS